MLMVKNEEGKWINIPSVLGPKGDSAYETAVNNGFEGTEKQWLESLEANVESISNIELEKILKL